MAPEPVIIPCEGSGCPTHQHGRALGICSMCGNLTVTEDDGRAYRHDRQDVMAMLARGDFDMPTKRAATASRDIEAPRQFGRTNARGDA